MAWNSTSSRVSPHGCDNPASVLVYVPLLEASHTVQRWAHQPDTPAVSGAVDVGIPRLMLFVGSLTRELDDVYT